MTANLRSPLLTFNLLLVYVQQKNFNDKESVVFMRKIFNRQLISANKHTMWCEGNAAELLLPADGVNKHLNA